MYVSFSTLCTTASVAFRTIAAGIACDSCMSLIFKVLRAASVPGPLAYTLSFRYPQNRKSQVDTSEFLGDFLVAME